MSMSGIKRLQWFYSVNSLIACVLCLAYYAFLANNGATAVKRQSITVGMYHTYSIAEGNLGRAEPDFKEVWEGAPGVSDFGACNITTHYWPWPEDLPDVEEGEDPYAVWWKEYMEEALGLWQREGLPQLRLKEPWWGINLGFWSSEDEEHASSAVKGDYYQAGRDYEQRRTSY